MAICKKKVNAKTGEVKCEGECPTLYTDDDNRTPVDGKCTRVIDISVDRKNKKEDCYCVYDPPGPAKSKCRTVVDRQGNKVCMEGGKCPPLRQNKKGKFRNPVVRGECVLIKDLNDGGKIKCVCVYG